MKKRISNIKFILVFILILIILITFSILNQIKETNNEILKTTSSISFTTMEDRNKSIIVLTELLDKYKHMNKYNKLILLNDLSKLYILNSDYQNGLKYSIEIVYLAQKTGDTFKAAKSLINISNLFTDLGGFDIAEETINYALSLKINDEPSAKLIKLYSYINLADIYSKNNNYDAALTYIDNSLELLDSYGNHDDVNYLTVNIIKARVFFYTGEISECKRILNELEVHVNTPSNTIAFNVKIPYLALKSKVEFYDGNITTGIDTAKKLFDLCDEEGLTEIKSNYIHYISEVLHKYCSEDSLSEIDLYQHELLSDYTKIMDKKNFLVVQFIIDECKSNVQALNIKNKNFKLSIQAGLILALIIILILLLIYAKKSKDQVETDELTKVYNRRKLNHEYLLLQNSNKPFGLIMIDIDYFKLINDKLGHGVGDNVLKNIAANMKTKLDKDYTLFRYGGEEFCVLCHNKSMNEIIIMAESLRESVAHMTWENDITVTISLGVSHSIQTNDLFKLADDNLYKSKETGRNKVTYSRLYI